MISWTIEDIAQLLAQRFGVNSAASVCIWPDKSVTVFYPDGRSLNCYTSEELLAAIR